MGKPKEVVMTRDDVARVEARIKEKDHRNAERELALVEAMRTLMFQRHKTEANFLHEKEDLVRRQMAEREHLARESFEAQWGVKLNVNGHGGRPTLAAAAKEATALNKVGTQAAKGLATLLKRHYVRGPKKKAAIRKKR